MRDTRVVSCTAARTSIASGRMSSGQYASVVTESPVSVSGTKLNKEIVLLSTVRKRGVLSVAVLQLPNLSFAERYEIIVEIHNGTNVWFRIVPHHVPFATFSAHQPVLNTGFGSDL